VGLGRREWDGYWVKWKGDEIKEERDKGGGRILSAHFHHLWV